MIIKTSNEPFCVTAYTMHEKPLCMSTASASWMKDTLWEMNRNKLLFISLWVLLIQNMVKKKF